MVELGFSGGSEQPDVSSTLQCPQGWDGHFLCSSVHLFLHLFAQGPWWPARGGTLESMPQLGSVIILILCYQSLGKKLRHLGTDAHSWSAGRVVSFRKQDSVLGVCHRGHHSKCQVGVAVVQLGAAHLSNCLFPGKICHIIKISFSSLPFSIKPYYPKTT